MHSEYAHSNAGSFEDFSGLGTRDRGDNMRHSFSDVPIGCNTSPSVNTPLYSYGRTPSSPSVGSQNGEFPTHGFSFGQPSPQDHGSTREYFAKNKEHDHGGTNKEAKHWRKLLDRCQKDLELCRSEKKDVSIRHFQCLKDLKKYDEAEELYHEISKTYDVGEEIHDVTERGREHDTNDDTKILGLKHIFADMLIEQQKFTQAEPISRAVWERRKHCPGPPSEDFQKSHRQLCFVLRSLRKFKDAEKMHNDMYQRGPKDEWALENGDEVCQTLKEQKDFKKAKILQEEVWKTRLEKHSPRDLTIRSGLRLIGFLDELIQPVDYVGGTDAERRLASSTRQALHDELEVTLEKIWDTRLHPEPNVNILDVGHKLGVLLLQDKNFVKAEKILASVWKSKKRVLGEANDSTMFSGSMLGGTICRQGKQERYPEAVKILQPIWLARQIGRERSDAGALSIFKDLAHAHCSLGTLGNLRQGECVYRWILQQKHQGDYPLLEVDEALWDLGLTLHKQGRDKDPEIVSVLEDLYRRWHSIAHNPDETLKCGQMLAQSLSTQDGRDGEALKIAQEVFEMREASENRELAHLESAQLYGSLLLKVRRHEEAGSILRSAWECQPGDPEERKLRLNCGHLYSQALAGRHKYTNAKRILEAVAAEQEGDLPAGASELMKTRRLLEEVVRQEERWKKGRTKARPKGRSRRSLAPVIRVSKRI